jgi:hypothetical protein
MDVSLTADDARKLNNGSLTFETAQWIKSPEQLAAVQAVPQVMSCAACGTTFVSNRCDSLSRHLKNGAWYDLLLIPMESKRSPDWSYPIA